MAARTVVASSHSPCRVGPGPGASPHRVAALPPASRPRVVPLAPASCRPWRPVGSASRPQWSESLVRKAQSPLEKAPVDAVAFPVAPFPWSHWDIRRSHWDHSRSQWDHSRCPSGTIRGPSGNRERGEWEPQCGESHDDSAPEGERRRRAHSGYLTSRTRQLRVTAYVCVRYLFRDVTR